jgi:hypothetical protein
VALIIVAHEHITSHHAERRLIWSAPSSFAKWAFLANRYFVLISLFISFIASSGFDGIVFSDTVRTRYAMAFTFTQVPLQSCRALWATVGVILMLSLALANGLIAMRVITLWDHHLVRPLHAYLLVRRSCLR